MLPTQPTAHTRHSLYHELVFLLQFSGFATVGMHSFNHTLDLTTVSGRVTLTVLAMFMVVTVLYTRLTRFATIVVLLWRQIEADGRVDLLYAGAGAVATMSVMNAILVVQALLNVAKALWRHMRPHEASTHSRTKTE